ncbi:MAG TPA: hypothetical protein DD435_10320 [Cyanobacteria bacterium UBA8530]|nr:hypothetical protein [Cyanobacteria bacterium UBA8530]
MAKIAVLDDFQALGRLLIGPLVFVGHDVRIWLSPIDFEEVLSWGPRLIKIVLYRKAAAFDRPIRNFEEDVLGFRPLLELEQYPAAQVVPIMLIGIGILERDIPTDVNYDLFLSFPADIDLYLSKTTELIEKVKTRRKISDYICPNCGSRLTFSKQPVKDLFCPRCHASVTIIENEGCIYQLPDASQPTPCTMEQLRPPPPKAGE